MTRLTRNHHRETETQAKVSDVQRLMDIINNRIDSGTRKPTPMPDGQQEGAKWFISILEPRMQFEIDELKTITKSDNDKNRIGQKYWHLPYQDRLAECLIAFYRLPHADQIQIVEWSGNNIMWRGDKISFMRKRAKVTPEFLADKGKLRKMLHSMIANIGKAS